MRTQVLSPCFSLFVHSQSSVPDLDLTGPVTGGRSGGEDRMQAHAQAGLSVGIKDVQQTGVLVVIEVSGAGGASRGQDCPIRRKFALHCVALHLEEGYDALTFHGE